MGVKNSPVAESGIFIYPNPASNYIKVQTNDGNETISGISVFNLMGQKIIQTDNPKLNVNEAEIRMENLSSGTYFVEIVTDKTSYMKKIIIAGK